MSGSKTDQLRNYALCVAFSAILSIGCSGAGFAQSAPPLGVPLAGRLPGPSIGCDVAPVSTGAGAVGLGASIGAANTTLAGSAGTEANANPAAGAGAGNDALGANLPLYGTDLNGNFPLYSTPNLGGNFPLYSTPTPGTNSPLYSNSSLSDYPALNNPSGTPGGLAVNNAPLRCRSGIPVGEWLLYPSIRLYSEYSDNLFLTPTAPTNVLGFGVTPDLIAEWTNGIHTTTIHADLDTQQFPTDTSINTLDREATITQKYSPTPDLTFTLLGDYTHKTISSALTNSIPTAVNTPVATPVLLPDGNIQLPNGSIVSPNGQIVGNANPALANSGITEVNPYNQYTATATVSKVFNGAILSFSSSLASTDYQLTQNTGPTSYTSFTSETFTGNGAVAVGPVLYLYSTGSFSLRTENASVDPNSDAYRVQGGIGTRQIGLFQASLYSGYQGSETEGSGTAGGIIYGAKLSYYPTLMWSIIAALDSTTNVTSQPCSSATPSTQALSLPTDTPVQIALSSCSHITTPSLQTTYQLSPQWTLLGDFNYSRIVDIDSPGVTNAWLASLTVSYEIRRNMTLSAQYQYTDIASNVAGESAKRNLIMVSAVYRF